MMRTHYCGAVNRDHLQQTVTLSGWAHRRRDHGGVIFIDLRDREGLVQVVCNPDKVDTFAIAEKIRNEFVLKVTGRVNPRPDGTVNPNLPPAKSKSSPTASKSSMHPLRRRSSWTTRTCPRNVRLTHRYLDLRRPVMQENMKLRYRVSRPCATTSTSTASLKSKPPC